MFQKQLQTRPSTVAATRAATLTITALLLLGLGVPSAAARQEVGPPTATAAAAQPAADGDQCGLRRVAAQLVKCDDLTGNGVPAPAWNPER